VDGLTTEKERALAWAATWHPSFHGTAIVNRNFEFVSVNPQFCQIVGVTPAELMGKKFTDVTPATIRELDAKNAELVMQGKITSYLLPKRFEFQSGAKVEIILLVVGVYATDGTFEFFVSRIMEQTIPTLKNQSTWFSGALSALKELTRKQWLQALSLLMMWASGAVAVYFTTKYLQP
jgi:PAS domain S-box-containing protein